MDLKETSTSVILNKIVNSLTFFSSPIGLGHATRDYAIAKNFEGISTKFVTGSVAVDFFKENGFTVDDAYTPPSFNVQDGTLKNSLNWLWKYYGYYKNCKVISSHIIEKNKPDLIVSDEDFASLSVGQSLKVTTILITDILETKFTKGFGYMIEKKMNSSMKSIMNKCNYVIIPETGDDEENIKRVGPIVRETKYSREELRKKFSFHKTTVVLSVGGTSAGKFLIDKTVKVFQKMKKDFDLVVVTGPALKINLDEKIRNFGFVSNLHELIYAGDLVISLAGKSTIDETKAYGTPGIFIPIKGHFEQEANAKQEGFNFDDIFNLDYLISKKLGEERKLSRYDGANKAYEIIKSTLSG